MSVPDRALSEDEIYRILARQADEILVRNACGREATGWIRKVHGRYGRRS